MNMKIERGFKVKSAIFPYLMVAFGLIIGLYAYDKEVDARIDDVARLDLRISEIQQDQISKNTGELEALETVVRDSNDLERHVLNNRQVILEMISCINSDENSLMVYDPTPIIGISPDDIAEHPTSSVSGYCTKIR